MKSSGLPTVMSKSLPMARKFCRTKGHSPRTPFSLVGARLSCRHPRELTRCSRTMVVMRGFVERDPRDDDDENQGIHGNDTTVNSVV